MIRGSAFRTWNKFGLKRNINRKRPQPIPSFSRHYADYHDQKTIIRPKAPLGTDGQLSTQYNFKVIEEDLYKWWEAEGFFKPGTTKDHEKKKPFTLPMPPPNVTGRLHMGHALFVAIQDILVRFQRMRGRSTLWLPGTDHAGIATQMLVERELESQGLTREGLGREKFLEYAWKYKHEKAGAIVNQIRRLGASADWSKEKFTLDNDMNAAVVEAFVQFHKDGLLYRGNRLVNWSPKLQSAVSDLEVEFFEEQGTLFYFKYILEDNPSQFIPVATTRPETILGDTALCVHPDDDRFKHLIGKRVMLPVDSQLGHRRSIPIIGDDYVDAAFGTGALKITPAHDHSDYEIGKRHNLELITIFNNDGTVNEVGGSKYQGLDRAEARHMIWSDMESEGLTLKKEQHSHRVPRSQRGGEVVEPMVSTQWFLTMDSMAKSALEVVGEGRIKIKPERFNKEWEHWLVNIRDWCISRQLWWGHRIPVWYEKGSDLRSASVGYFVGRHVEEALQEAHIQGHHHLKVEDLVQDEDVLDTWFSSGLWPFATLGWPNSRQQDKDQKNLMDRYFPTSILETGYDILFFWVARMVMMSSHLTNQIPFETIYLHGLVRDAQGQKMSKTKGNVIDPLDAMAQYGTDALRYTLVTGVTPGQDIPLSMERMETSRNFANKLWNIGRYLIHKIAKEFSLKQRQAFAVKGPILKEELDQLRLPERYIVTRCHEVINHSTTSLDNCDISDVGISAHRLLYDVADWYIEASKTRKDDDLASARVLVYVFDCCLRLLHPYMPFVTEILWQELPIHAPQSGKSLMVSRWPLMQGEPALVVDNTAVAHFECFMDIAKAVRNARVEHDVDLRKKVSATVYVEDSKLMKSLIEEKQGLALLGRMDLKTLSIESQCPLQENKNVVRLVVGEGLMVDIPLNNLVDTVKEKQRLTKQAVKLEKDLTGVKTRMKSSGFLKKASERIITDTTALLAEKEEHLEKVNQRLKELETT